ncbi:MAG: hypothetical protein JJT89_01685 [Nitriliruptoraceae bacterium]|nr:hypothetical protein [Nitriliruptoraceae bacterium]
MPVRRGAGVPLWGWARLAAALVLVAGCGGPQGPQQVALAELVEDTASYEDTEVVTEGVLRAFEEPFHVWIEDEVPNRVELVPVEQVEDLVGLRVEVRGTFTFADDRGRVIDLDEVTVLEGDPRAAPPAAAPSSRVGSSTTR